MHDNRVDNLAKIIVNYSLKVRPGDNVFLGGATAAAPLVNETYRQILRAGGHPLLIWSNDRTEEIFLNEANDEQLSHISGPMRQIYETYDCFINIVGATNTRSLSGTDPAHQRLMQDARRPLAGIFSQRAAEGSARWVVTMYPTNAHAQDADMSLSDFEDFVYGACFADQSDPVRAWIEMSAEQERLVEWLAGRERVEVRGPHVDLSFSVAGRTFINSDGTKNMPDGEIFTGPVEDSVNGRVRFTHPAIVSGREVAGVELCFEDGRVVEASAAKNEEYLLEMLETDPGARYLGEFAIGTNKGIRQFTRSILFDEKIGGTIHMALGRGYPETGSKNESGIHWDMICDMRDASKILVDGDLFYRNGEFVI